MHKQVAIKLLNYKKDITLSKSETKLLVLLGNNLYFTVGIRLTQY